MPKIPTNVQKLDVRVLDILRNAFARGVAFVSVRQRSVKFNWWTGNIQATETVVRMEQSNDRS